MKTLKVPSPARSEGAILTPKRHQRASRSVSSPARSNVSGRLTSIIEDYNNQDSFAFSPLTNRKSVLNDNTNIEEPRRASWWKKLNENSRDVIEVMNAHEEVDAINIIEEYVDILSQEKKNYTLDLPDSSDNESINSIVIPQRKLFTQKDTQPQKIFREISGKRETLTKINNTNNDYDKCVKVTTKNLFGHGTKRSRPVFPEALLNISHDKTAANKTKEQVAAEVKGQVKSLFGNRPGVKRKNMFLHFIVSESEDEIPEIEPKIFAFPKKPKSFRRPSSSSRASSVTTDVEMDDWNMLPSSTMVDHQLEDNALHENEDLHLYYEDAAEDNQENDEPTLIEKQNKQNEDEVINSSSKEKSKAKEKESSIQIFENIAERSTRSINKSNNKNSLNKSTENKLNKLTTQKGENKSKSNLEVISDEKCDEIQEETATGNSNTQQIEIADKSLKISNKSQELDNSLKTVNKSKSRFESDQIIMDKSNNKLQRDSGADTENLEQNDQYVKHQSMAIDNQKVVEETQEEIDELMNENSLPYEKDVNASIHFEAEQNDLKMALKEPEPNKSHQECANVSKHEKNDLNLNKELDRNGTSEDENDQDKDLSQKQADEMELVNDSQDETEQNDDESEHEECILEEEQDEIDQNNQSEMEQNDSEEENQNDSEEEKPNESGEEEQNESEEEEQNEMEDSEQEQNSSQAVAVESDDEDEAESDQEVADQTDEQIETNDDDDEQHQSDHFENEENQEQNESMTNLTHDTTGRYRNKHIDKSPEAVLQSSADPGETFMSKGRNTSIRKTKSIIKNLNIKPSLEPVSESMSFSDGTRNSSTEGSGWDSHRTTRKTIRQTLGKDFSSRKSLRALVMEKSAKRFTTASVLNDDMSKMPQANSTEFPGAGIEDSDMNIDSEEPVHEVSKRTRQATLEKYLQSIKRKNIQIRLQMEEEVINSIKNTAEAPTYFKKPSKPGFALHKANSKLQKKQPKSKVVKSTIIPLEDLPVSLLEDMKYKPPKRYKPSNAAWITKRLYNFLESKLEPKYDFKARLRAERLVENIYNFTKDARRHPVAAHHAVDVLKREMATLQVVHTHFDFYNFFHEYMPREIRVKVVPDIVNELPLPKNGVFSNIL